MIDTLVRGGRKKVITMLDNIKVAIAATPEVTDGINQERTLAAAANAV